MKHEKLSKLILANDKKESLYTEDKVISTSIENSNILLKINLENKVYTEIILPNEEIDSASLRICNKYDIPYSIVKNEITKRKTEIKKIEPSFHISINEKSKIAKGVSFEVSSIEKKNLSSNRTNTASNSNKPKLHTKLNKSHYNNNPINKSPKKNISHFQTTNCSSISTGKRLYELGKSMNEEKDKEINSFRHENMKKTQEECTFTPKLNENSIILSFKKNYNSAQRVPKCFQNSPAKLSSKTIEVDISTSSKKKVLEPTPKELELFSKLYNKAKLLEKNKETLTEEIYSKYSFKPDIKDKSEPDIKNFYNRLQTWTEKKKAKDNSLLQNSMMDPKSNQIFFSPVINKKSLETNKKRDIFNDLFNKHKQLKFRQEENRKKNIEEYNSANCKKLISEQSEKITEEIEINMIKRIFESLDSDGDNYISEEDIKNYCHLDELKVLNPILDNIKGDIKLDIVKFKKEIKEKITSYKNKKVLKDWYMNNKNQHSHRCTHNKNNEPQFSYQPTVSDSSNEVLAKSTRHSKGFMARNNEFYQRRMTLQLEQLNKIEEVSKECTFQPSLDKKLPEPEDYKRKTSKNFTTLTKRATVNLDNNQFNLN